MDSTEPFHFKEKLSECSVSSLWLLSTPYLSFSTSFPPVSLSRPEPHWHHLQKWLTCAESACWHTCTTVTAFPTGKRIFKASVDRPMTKWSFHFVLLTSAMTMPLMSVSGEVDVTTCYSCIVFIRGAKVYWKTKWRGQVIKQDQNRSIWCKLHSLCLEEEK